MGGTCNPTPSQNSEWSHWNTSSPTCQCPAGHAIYADDGPLKAKAGHAIKVVGSHRHLPLNNMKGVGSIPPPLNEALRQGGTRRLF